MVKNELGVWGNINILKVLEADFAPLFWQDEYLTSIVDAATVQLVGGQTVRVVEVTQACPTPVD